MGQPDTAPMWFYYFTGCQDRVGILMSLRGNSATGRVFANGIRVVCPIVGRGGDG
jgi:hypothetical protein